MLQFFSSLSRWDWLDISGVALVFIGVLGEILVRRKRTPDGTNHEIWERETRKWEKRWENALLVGLALELAALPHHFIEAGDLNHKAGEAKRLAGEANARAEAESMERAKIELELTKLKTPRTITPQQKAKFIEVSRSFRKGPVGLATGPGNTEIGNYKMALRGLLIDAGYTIGRDEIWTIGNPAYQGTNRPNVFLVIGAVTNTIPHGLGLQRALAEIGVDAPLILGSARYGEIYLYVSEKY
jgi:hypothetical protein